MSRYYYSFLLFFGAIIILFYFSLEQVRFWDLEDEKRRRVFQDIIILFYFSLGYVRFWDLEDEKRGDFFKMGRERDVSFFGAEGILQFDGESGIHRKREDLSWASG